MDSFQPAEGSNPEDEPHLRNILGKKRSSISSTCTPHDLQWQSSKTLETLRLQGFNDPDPTLPSHPPSTVSQQPEQQAPFLAPALGAMLEIPWMPHGWLEELGVPGAGDLDTPH
ncbi:uncharacterized protein BT62DRAFT_1007597 [Guyanagaster necrorhizus]|uniref:Uncharacterized protein n=1 Tax=Guyanagaster necrorhizus TaxID=856835 RepID=A0A9P7VPQ5_9AGAR|nr:uncharacterized protein BT62DRAFT_1007597 [Guyanagaster necrorhizus MCA 3950]KAG7444594.1 hypothetical protein BT62DRAFT_1007597 [Guyanagaster necrorhizus MCA 3950]